MPRMIFEAADGVRREVEAASGKSILDIAHDNGIDIEGACEACMACATCHVIVDAAFYDRLDPPSEAEMSMLDLALGITPTSRLGCQVVLTEALDGLAVRLPDDVLDLREI
ncbi:MAG: 2Fe-2S iron-sulfur cluster-binding protein [Alphaproteobacteria bacterium]|nr:2Fe-2S iron-sulfur cluster-binding protein [Alphaproteobacteria bacterium]